MGNDNMKYIFFEILILLAFVAVAQQKSSNIRLPLSLINQRNISTQKAIKKDTLPLLFVKAKDSVKIDSIVLKRIADSLVFLEYNEKAKSENLNVTSVNTPAKFDSIKDISINTSIRLHFDTNITAGYVVKPVPNPFEKDTIIISSEDDKITQNFATNHTISPTPEDIKTQKNHPNISNNESTIEVVNAEPSKQEEKESIRKYYQNRRYATGYFGLGYNMSLVDVCGGVRLYQFNNLPIYFEIDLFFNSFYFKKFIEPIYVYRVMPTINVGYTYEFSDFLNGMGLSASAGVGPYHEGYSLLTDVGFEPIIKDERFIKFAWDWAVDITFSIDKEQKYRLMLKHKMMYLTKSNFGNTIQSISVNMLFRLDYKKVEERRKIENIYLNY